MTYSTLMAHLAVERANDSVLSVAADLAERLGASVIGIAACQPLQIIYGAGYVAGEIVDMDREEIDEEMRKLEANFRAAFAVAHANPQWRAARTPRSLAAYIATEARAADLIITAPDRATGLVNNSRRVGIGELAMRAGRPVLIVPDDAKTLDLEHVVIGWHDSRETRRAVADSLPILALAGRVTVVELATEDRLVESRQSLDEVVAWLKRHQIEAEALIAPLDGAVTARLEEIARERRAGLMVAGAYGHNRVREWMFGGVTCDLLMHPARCTLVSH
ncbi:MAG: universal stress protein [Caulobacteraceae bacterium]